LRSGKAPGCHVQTGQTCVFGFAEKSCSFLHLQNIFAFEFSFK